MKIWRTGKIKLHTFLILVSTSSALLLLMTMGVVLYSGTVKEMEERIEHVNKIKFNQIAAGIDHELGQLDKLTEYIKNNQRLMSYIAELENGPDSYTSHVLSVKISNLLFNIKQYMDSIKSINVITGKAQYNGGNILFNYHLLRKYSDTKSDTVQLVLPQRTVSRNEQDPHYYHTAKLLDDHFYFRFSLSDDGKHYGNVYMILNDILPKSKFAGGDRIILTDHEQHIVWSTQANPKFDVKALVAGLGREVPGAVLSDDLSRKVYSRQLAFRGWHVLFVSEKKLLGEQLKLLRNLMITALVLSVLIGLILSQTISKTILLPVRKLIRLMRDYTDNTVPGSIMKKKNSFSLRERLFLYFMLSILVPVGLFITLYYYQSNTIIKEQVIHSYNTLFEKAAINVEEYLSGKQMIVQRIAFDRNVIDYVRSHEANKDNDSEVILEIFEENKFLGLDRDTISLFNLDDNRLLLSNRLNYPASLHEDDYDRVKRVAAGMTWSLNKDELNKPVISLGMNFGLLHSAGESAYIQLDIDSLYLAAVYSELKSDHGEAFIVDESNHTFSHSYPENIGREQEYNYYGWSGAEKIDISGSEYLLFGKKLGVTPLYLIFKYNYRDLMRQSSAIWTENVYLFIILFLLIVVLSYVVTFVILNPVNSLNRKYVEFDPLESDSAYSHPFFIEDIDMLRSTFNQMTERIEKLIDELIIVNITKSKLETEKKDAEIKSLQAQINPHFLYNTLDSINYMIKKNQSGKSVMMVNALSDLFRYGISRRELLISVDEEIKYARAYTDIMNARYDGEIQFTWNVDEAALEQRVIKLILQPVIENAIYYGISGNREHKVISISCMTNGNILLFEVEDNGAGMSEAKLVKVRDSLAAKDASDHLGMYNVQSRINLYYSGTYGIDIHSVQGSGTTVRITVPIIDVGRS